MKDLVSIGIPTYNGERYLKESLQAVVDQSYRNLEVLVVDDQSSDGTLEIVKAFQKEDSRIKLHINEQNLGLVANWNKCIQLASGDWFKLHFQDDLMNPSTIEEMVAFAHRTDTNVVLTDRQYFFEDGIKDPFVLLPRLSHFFNDDTVIEPTEMTRMLLEQGLEANFMGEPILGLVNRSLLSTYGGYDESLRQIVDFEYWLRIGLNERIAFTPKKLHQFRVHLSSESARNSAKKGIRPSDIDEVHLAYKIMNHANYQAFRGFASDQEVTTQMQQVIRDHIVNHGFSRLRNEVDKAAFDACSLGSWSKFRAHFNDILYTLRLR